MEDLPDLALEHVTFSLPLADLLHLRLVSSRLRQAVDGSRAIGRFSDAFFARPGVGFEEFAAQCRLLGRYRHCLGRFRRAFAAIAACLNQHSLPVRLKPPATEEELDAVEAQRKSPLPLQIRACLLVHNGQEAISEVSEALFGWLHFYDARLIYLFLGANFLGQMPSPPGLTPILATVGSEKSMLCVHGASGNLIWATGHSWWKLAPSLLDFVESYAQKLTSGCFDISPVLGVTVFPRHNIPSCTTRGILVTASPVFIPTQSHAAMRRYAFTYSISIKGTATAPRCRLATRHWIIDKGDDSEPEEVRGPGVVGLFPEIEPDCAWFSYQSMCITRGAGSMRGSFTFQAADGEEFDVQVPLFRLEPPEAFFLDDE